MFVASNRNFQKVGSYDVTNFRHYGSDDEFSMRVKNFDMNIACPKSIVYLREDKESKNNLK